jgi:hypothetical protein
MGVQLKGKFKPESLLLQCDIGKLIHFHILASSSVKWE